MISDEQKKAMRDRLEHFEHASPPTREDMFRFAKAECDLVLQPIEQQKRLAELVKRLAELEDVLVLSRARLQKIRRVLGLLRTECERLRGEKAEATTLSKLADDLEEAIIAKGQVVLSELLVSPDDSSESRTKEMERVRAEVLEAILNRGDCLNCGGYGGTGHPCSACGGSGKMEDQVRQLQQDQKELVAEVARLREFHDRDDEKRASPVKNHRFEFIALPREGSGKLTTLGLALDSIQGNGCDCGTDEPGTCIACRCEKALRELWLDLAKSKADHLRRYADAQDATKRAEEAEARMGILDDAIARVRAHVREASKTAIAPAWIEESLKKAQLAPVKPAPSTSVFEPSTATPEGLSTDEQNKKADELASVLERLEREMRKWATMDGGAWLQQPAVTPVNLTASQGAAIVAELDRLRAEAAEYESEVKSAINALDIADKELAAVMEALGADMIAGEGIGNAAVRMLDHRARENAELRQFLSDSRTALYNLSFAMRDHMRQAGCAETDNMAEHIADADKLVALLTSHVSGLAAHPVSQPAEKSSEGSGTPVPVGDLLSGDPEVENAFALVPVNVMSAIVSEHASLITTCAELKEALIDISHRIDSQNNADPLRLGGREALNDIARRIARLREVQRERDEAKTGAPKRMPSETATRAVWVAADDARNAVEQVAYPWPRTEQEALAQRKLPAKCTVRVVIIATKERSKS